MSGLDKKVEEIWGSIKEKGTRRNLEDSTVIAQWAHVDPVRNPMRLMSGPQVGYVYVRDFATIPTPAQLNMIQNDNSQEKPANDTQNQVMLE